MTVAMSTTKKPKKPKAPKLFPDELIDQLLAQVQVTGRCWPNPAVGHSIAGCQAEKITDGHDRPESTQSGPLAAL